MASLASNSFFFFGAGCYHSGNGFAVSWRNPATSFTFSSAQLNGPFSGSTFTSFIHLSAVPVQTSSLRFPCFGMLGQRASYGGHMLHLWRPWLWMEYGEQVLYYYGTFFLIFCRFCCCFDQWNENWSSYSYSCLSSRLLLVEPQGGWSISMPFERVIGCPLESARLTVPQTL